MGVGAADGMPQRRIRSTSGRPYADSAAGPDSQVVGVPTVDVLFDGERDAVEGQLPAGDHRRLLRGFEPCPDDRDGLIEGSASIRRRWDSMTPTGRCLDLIASASSGAHARGRWSRRSCRSLIALRRRTAVAGGHRAAGRRALKKILGWIEEPLGDGALTSARRRPSRWPDSRRGPTR